MKIPKIDELQERYLLKIAIEKHNKLETIDVVDKMQKCQYYNDYTIVSNYLWEWHNKLKDGDLRKKTLSMMLTCFTRMTCYNNSLEMKTQETIHLYQESRFNNSILRDENEKLKKEIDALKKEIEFLSK